MCRKGLSVWIVLYSLALAIWLPPACGAANVPASEPTPAPHLIVISIDGLMPAAYLHPEQYNLRIPHLRGLLAKGASAAGVEGVFPSVTYPSHATLVTGVTPPVHGIYANQIFTDPSRAERKFFWKANAFRVPTLWDAAREAGLKTAAVGWPGTVGAAIDYHLAEIWDPNKEGTGKDFGYAASYSTPGLVEAIEREFGRSTSKPLDEARTDAAVYILRQFRPNLLLLHIYDLDTAQHDFGPLSPPALQALELADEQIGRLIETARELGILGQATFVVVSDHGFLPIKKHFNLGRFLVAKGFLAQPRNHQTRRWAAAPLTMGGSAYLFLRQPAREKEIKKLYVALEPYVRSGAIAAVFSPAATKELTGVEGAMMVEAGAGYSFREGWTRPAVVEDSQRRGRHGYLPFRPNMEASFIAAGAGIKPGARLPQIRMTAIAPTLAALLGVNLTEVDRNLLLSAILEK